MKLSVLITGSIGIVLLLAILGCSSATSVEVMSTPHAEATFEPKTDTPTSSAPLGKIEHSHETHYKNTNALTESGLLNISEIEQSVRCAVGRGSNCSQEPAIERGLFETGLEPIFPLGVRCPVTDHHYAMDYSEFRLGKEYYHGGIDIPVPFNTPVIAAATGQVVGIYAGDKSPRGIEIVFRHSPEDTGLPVWTFTQYTHFSELPDVVLGQSIEIGDVIGLTGNTGISPKTGKQADARRPALHFGVLYNSNGEYADMKNAAIVPADAKWMDPNAFFLVDHPFDTATLKALPENEKAVPIPVLLDDGNTIPSDTKTVWPYTCSKQDANTTEPKKEMPQTAQRDAVATELKEQTSQPTVLGRYLMSFSSCDTAVLDCHLPQNHEVFLAESENGLTWSLVSEWESYPGSVPDVIRRGDKLYVYDRQYLTKYDLVLSTQDPHTPGSMGEDRSKRVTVEGLDDAGYVDPSLIVDDEGRIVLFFMHGLRGADPAQCLPGESSCVKYFGSATEVDGSDGKLFKLDDGYRTSITVGVGGHLGASDPDIFFDGNQYVLYISHGTAISVWTSRSLKGNYSHVGDLSVTEGGVPSGYYHQNTGKYWTFSHITQDGVTIIRRANHTELTKNLSEQKWVNVVSAPVLGLASSMDTGSPGFAVND